MIFFHKKTWHFLLFTIAYLLFISYATAQPAIEFIENKNQWHNNVLYKADLFAGALFLENNCFTYNLVQVDDIKHSHAHHDHQNTKIPKIIHFHAYKVNFVNANKDVKIYPSEHTPDYCNYFIGKDPARWASYVKKYKVVEYRNIYEDIDMKVYSNRINLKYDFIVYPGAEVENIVLYYEGIDNMLIRKGNLIIETSVNEITELKPFAYQIIDGDKVETSCKYKLKDNNVTFSFPSGYDHSKQLIIDPVLIFATYSGSTTDNWGFTATYDNEGNVYSGGIAFYEAGFSYPVSLGAYQEDFGGPNILWGNDVAIIKYNPTGTDRLFATYLGGNSSEMPHSLVVNEYNELIILGTTGSVDFPVTSNAYDTTFNYGTSVSYDNVIDFNNGTDIYIARLSPDGSQLLASTYIGGTANDGLNFRDSYNSFMMHGNGALYYNYADGARGEIIVDGKNCVYIGTCTFSNDFPVTGSAFQTTNSGNQEGVVFKLDINLSMLMWSSYIGGSGDDAVYSIDNDETYQVYIAGGTSSTDFPTTAGAYQPNYIGGSTDGFVAHFSSNGDVLYSSTFFGSPDYDQAYFVRSDKSKNIYITGQTEASGNTLIFNALYNTPNSGQFIAKFPQTLDTLIWSTVFGTGNGKPNISITAFTVDVCYRIYLSGWGREWANHDGYTWANTEGTKGMDITPGAYQTTTDGQDFYVMVLADDASNLEYATFLGELYYSGCYYSGHDHVDGGTSRFDRKGNIYQSVCASCGSCDSFPTFPNPGVWSPNNGAAIYGNNCNNAVFRFSFLEDFAIADFWLPPTGCAPYTITFNNTSLGTDFLWNFGDGSPLSTDTNPTHTYLLPGTYNVTLIASDPASCNLADTIIKHIEVISDIVDTIADVNICLGDNEQIGIAPSGNPSTTYSWIPSSNLSDTTISNPFASPDSTTTYILLVFYPTNCVDSIYQTVNVHTNVLEVIAEHDTAICPGETVMLYATASDDVISYIWSSSSDISDTLNIDLSDSTFIVTPLSDITYYVQANGEYCGASAIDSVNISVFPIDIEASPDTFICLGDSIFLNAVNLIPGDTLSYIWSPDTSIISGENTANPLVNPIISTTYYITVTNQLGCEDIESVNVNVDDFTISLINVENATCYGFCDGQITVSSMGVPPYIYQWSDMQTGSIAVNLCPGIYGLTVTDNIGCEKILDNIIITGPLSSLSVVADTSGTECDTCNGVAIVTPSGGTSPYTYLWDSNANNQTTSTVTGLCMGVYQVTVTDDNGCDTILTVEIVDPSDLEASITNQTDIICYGYCYGSATVTAANGVPGYTYAWSSGGTEATETGLCADTFYIVTVTDSENCKRYAYVILTEPDEIISDMTISEDIICYDDSASATVYNVTGGTSPYTYLWDSNAGNQTTSTVTGLYDGTYYVTITDTKGCTSTNNIIIIAPPKIDSNSVVDDSSCLVCKSRIFLMIEGGVSPYDYKWNTVPAQYSQNIFDLCDGSYTVTVTDSKGCELILTFYVEASFYVPFLDVTADTNELYPGQSTILHATYDPGYIYSWLPLTGLNNYNIPDPVATLEYTSTYKVFIVDANGCENNDTITITVNDVICGEPYIYIPNAFTPNDDNNNDIIYVQSNVIDRLYFAIYDRWGEMVFVTEDINQGWDGTYKGEKLDPAVFVYYLKATCLDQMTFEKKGNITLIR